MKFRPSPIAAFGIAATGIALFSVMDALMKGLSLAIGVYNAMLWRNLAALPISGLIYAVGRSGWPSRETMRVHVLRGLNGAVMAPLFFWGLVRTPLAQGVALSFIAPVVALFLAALLLNERISRATISASVLAFGGVLVILFGQVRAELGPEALLGSAAILLSALSYAWNIILMRQQAQIAGPAEVAFFQTLYMVLGLAVAAPWLMQVPELVHVMPLMVAAMLAIGSLVLLGWAYAHADASYLAPVEYTAFIWASLLGWIFFAEGVSLLTVAGAVMIVAGCVISARQRKGPPIHVETTAV